MSGSVHGWRVLAGVWMAVVLVFAVLPTHAALEALAGEGESLAASAGHFVEFVVLAVLLALALGNMRSGPRLLAVGLGSVALGIAIEALQMAIPYRSAQVGDVLVDAAGAVAGLLVYVSAVALAGDNR